MVLGALGAAAFPAEEHTPEVRAAVVATAPVVDGVLDEEVWSRARPWPLDRIDQVHPNYRDSWDGPADLSATLRVLRSGDDLYLGIQVRDDSVCGESGRYWWDGDSIEVFLDSDLVSPEDDSRYSDDDRQLFLLPFHEGQRWGVWSRGPDLPYPDGGLREVVVSHTLVPGGYVVEARIPLWSLNPLRPDERGAIGFDLAINDIDAAGDKSYLTLSGRTDLHLHPDRLARLVLGPLAPLGAAGESDRLPVDWTRLLAGLALVLLLVWAARRLERTLARGTRLRAATLCGLLAAAAALVSALPSLAALLDERGIRRAQEPTLERVETAARTCLRLDTGPPQARANRLLALLRDGEVRIRPRYLHRLLPLRPAVPEAPASQEAPGTVRYGIALEPGESRSFPLEAIPAPARIRIDLEQETPEHPEREASDQAAAALRLEFADGEPIESLVTSQQVGRRILELAGHGGQSLRMLTVRNLLPFRKLTVVALYGIDALGKLRLLPLAVVTATGVPLDIWHDRPATNIAPVPPNGVLSIPGSGAVGDRLWIALRAEGAYPRSAYGAEVAWIRVRYRTGPPGPRIQLVNGRDLADHLLAYTRSEKDPGSIALQWEGTGRTPLHYTLHALDLDPTRSIAAIEVADLGVLTALRVVAATIGRRTAAIPSPASGLELTANRLRLRPDLAARLAGLGFTVRAPGGAASSSGPAGGVRLLESLDFSPEGAGTLELRVQRGNWAQAILSRQALLFGLAALLVAFAAVVAGASLLRRARRLRVKMLVALGAATVMPLLFLAVSLTQTLNTRAEADLESATRAELRDFKQRLLSARTRARELALRVKDTLEIVSGSDDARMLPLVRRSREEIEAQGAFLRLPGLDRAQPSTLGNTSFVDTVQRTGIYYSPWDGLLALGLARTDKGQECIVGFAGASALPARVQGGLRVVVYGPGGEPLAAAGGPVPDLDTRRGFAQAVRRLKALRASGKPIYEARGRLDGRAMAAAHDLILRRGRVVGMIGLFHPRAATESAKAATLQTIVLSAFAALLLVAVAGAALVERVTRRLGRVTRAAQAIAGGDLSGTLPIEGADEVARLARSFNRMADSLRRRVGQITEMQRGLQDLAGALEREEVAHSAAALLLRATGCRQVAIAVYDPATDRLETLHRSGEGAPLARRPESGPVRDALEDGQALLREGALFLPLVASKRVVGIAVCSPVEAEGEVDRTFLEASGRQIGIALENARLYRAAVTDERTGLYTYAFFVRRLKEEVDRAAAMKRPLSLLRLVVEDYDALARSRGPSIAARFLAEAAEVIAATVPARNMLAQRAPGELLLLLVESDAGAARVQIDRVADAMKRHRFLSLGAQAEPPSIAFRSVSYPRDGAAADILLDAFFEAAEVWEGPPPGQAPLPHIPPSLGLIIGRSAAMRTALEVIPRVAPTNATVLMSGETGTGKEVLADLIQANSSRRDKPYLKVNCAAIPETLLEAELFGHERGAFTGADRRRIGRFEQAHTGTLFLDEIGDLPLAMQAKLLRVLQERSIQRVGGGATIAIDVRILAASNRSLAEAVRSGAFREDLYHRLHVIELRVPPLRERREDIPPLIEHFRKRFNRRHGLEVSAFAPEALDALYRHGWPGNVRELRNVIERSMLLSGGATVEAVHLALPHAAGGKSAGPEGPEMRIEGLTPRQEAILSMARAGPGITNSDVVREQHVSPRTALRELQKLVERGLLVRIGRRRGAVYKPPA